jgi:hypothetical protein
MKPVRNGYTVDLMVRRRFFSAVSNHGLRSASEPSFETPRKKRGSSG